MKVTVNFGGTKIVVPCGDGDISVKELTDLAAVRYKKAVIGSKSGGGGSSFWISVASLRSREGGMLDPDDLICDVCDDREQLQAVFDQQVGVVGGGDGTSGSDSDKEAPNSAAATASVTSSSSTSSSQIRQKQHHHHQYHHLYNHGGSKDNNGGHILQARRGSEPSFERTAFSGASHTVGDSQDPQDAPPNNLTKTGLASGSVQAVVASINAMSSKSQNGWNRHQDFTRHRSKSTLGPNQLWPPASSSALENEQRSTLRSSLRMTMVKGRSHEEHHQGNDDIYISHANSGSLSPHRRPAGGIFDTRGGQMKAEVPGCADEEVASRGDGSNLDSLPDSQSFETKCSLNVSRRKEPLGASTNRPERTRSPAAASSSTEKNKITSSEPAGSFEIVIKNEIGPLGIHVVPCDEDGRLVVQGIEPGGRVDRDGRLTIGDEIVSINEYPLKETSFNQAQDIFKEALFAKDLRLRVVKTRRRRRRSSPTGQYDGTESCVDSGQPAFGSLSIFNNKDQQQQLQQQQQLAAGTKITAAVNANNTRKIGTMVPITLTKGPVGLGFSITTRDNALGGSTPIYIKNILPKGAAIEEGTLKPGDRLLEVNGVGVDGLSQSEVVSMLKNIPLDSDVDLVVSRHVATTLGSNNHSGNTSFSDDPTSVSTEKKKGSSPSKYTSKKNAKTEQRDDSQEPSESIVSTSFNDNPDDTQTTEDLPFPWKQRQILTFDIPVHDSERAGLGVSVKGKTSSSKEGVVDLGIFVKSVLHGGAASMDGRLKTNDQLVNINGMSLLGKSNPEAMETLRKAMHEEGPIPGVISLTVARRESVNNPSLQGHNQSGKFANSKSGLKNYDEFGMIDSDVRDDERGGDSLSSQVTSSDDDIVREYNVQPAQANSFKMPILLKGAAARNPVVDRLMGKESAGILASNLRNDSYYMATNDTWNGSTIAKPHSTNNGLGLGNSQAEVRPRQVFDGEGKLRASSSVEEDVDATTESLSSLVDVRPFSRDQPGRQSMSEKRHATLDAKNTDTYQKRKKAREDREQSQREEQQRRMWKKSASLESLHTQAGGRSADGLAVGLDEAEAIRSAYVRANSVRVSRNRGCNESFRAAVDRSYEKEFPDNYDDADDPDFVIEDLGPARPSQDTIPQPLDSKTSREGDAAGDLQENLSANSNVPTTVVLRRKKDCAPEPAKDCRAANKGNNRNSRLLTGLSSMFGLSKKAPAPPVPPAAPARQRHLGSEGYHEKPSKSVSRKSLPAPNTLPSGAGGARMTSSSSSMIPSSRSLHGQLSDYVNDRQLTDNVPIEDNNEAEDDLMLLYRVQNQPLRPAPVFDHHQHHHLNHHNRPPPPPKEMMHHQWNVPIHSRSHSHPRNPNNTAAKDVYEYYPSAMMRPGSRVGIADPGHLTSSSSDYDVLQRLQNQPPAQRHAVFLAPPPVPGAHTTSTTSSVHSQSTTYHHHHQLDVYYHRTQQPQPILNHHARSGSNLSNGSGGGSVQVPTSAANQQQFQSAHHQVGLGGVAPPKPNRPRARSTYYDYDYNYCAGGSNMSGGQQTVPHPSSQGHVLPPAPPLNAMPPSSQANYQQKQRYYPTNFS